MIIKAVGPDSPHCDLQSRIKRMLIAAAVLFLGQACSEYIGNKGVFVPPKGSLMSDIKYANLNFIDCTGKHDSVGLQYLARNFPNISCDITTEGGGWVVIARRFDGFEGFFREWWDYKVGFGGTHREHYIGHFIVNLMVTQDDYYLRIDMVFRNQKYYAKYGLIKLTGEVDGYRLKVGDYEGTAGDSLSYHNDKQFSAPDRNHNKKRYFLKCLEYTRSSWWFAFCQKCNLFGQWQGQGYGKSVHWYTITDYTARLDFVEMKLKVK